MSSWVILILILLSAAGSYADPPEQAPLGPTANPAHCLLIDVEAVLARPKVVALRTIVRSLPKKYREYLEWLGDWHRGTAQTRSLAEGIARFMGSSQKVVAEIQGAKVIFRSTDPAIGVQILEDVNRGTYRILDPRARMYLDWDGNPRVSERADARHEGQALTHFDYSTFSDEGATYSARLEAELDHSKTSRIFLLRTSRERCDAILSLDWRALSPDERGLLQLNSRNVQIGTKYEIDALLTLAERSQDPSWIAVLDRWTERLEFQEQNAPASWQRWILTRIKKLKNALPTEAYPDTRSHPR